MVNRMQGLHVLPFSDMDCPSPTENTGVTVTVYSVSDCRFFSTVLWVWPGTWTWMEVTQDKYQVLLINFCSYKISISLVLLWCLGTVQFTIFRSPPAAGTKLTLYWRTLPSAGSHWTSRVLVVGLVTCRFLTPPKGSEVREKGIIHPILHIHPKTKCFPFQFYSYLF